jgi:hypothetical protein
MSDEVKVFTAPDGEQLYQFSRSGPGWARIFITDKGQFIAASDYGGFEHWWGAVGGDKNQPYLLRTLAFIAGVEKDPGYFIRKLCYGKKDVYDGVSTLKSIKQYIIESRQDESLDRETARELWDEFEYYDIEGNEYDFNRWMDAVQHLDEPWEFRCTVPDRDTVAFVERVMVNWLAPLIRKQVL